MENNQFFNSWLDSQKKIMESWVEATDNFQKSFSTAQDSGNEGAAKEVVGLYKSWIGTMGKSFEETVKNFPFSTAKDTCSKLFSGANAYVKLLELWEPFVKSSQENGFDLKSCQEMYNPEKYQEVIDAIFGFNPAENIQEFYGQAARLTETWGAGTQDFVKPWAEAIQKNIREFPHLLSGGPEAGFKMFNNLYGTFENDLSRVLNMPAVGKDRESIELLMRCFDKFSKYLTMYTDFQHKMYVTGQKAMTTVSETLGQKAAEGIEIKKFDEFFKIWTDVNDKTYLELFETEEFSKLQAQLLETALEARKHFQQLMENSMKDFPLPLRSEMDDVYQTIYQLKKRVRDLEKKLEKSSAKKGSRK